MLAVAIGIVLGSTTVRILLGGPRGPGSKAWIKRCDYHKSRGDPVALSSHQVATSMTYPGTMAGPQVMKKVKVHVDSARILNAHVALLLETYLAM